MVLCIINVERPVIIDLDRRIAMTQRHLPETALSKWQMRGFALERAVFAPHEKVPDHSHASAFFCIALRGVCTEQYGRKERTFEPSAMSYLPPGNTHSLRFYQAGMDSFSIEIEAKLLERIREYSLKISDSVHCRGGQLTMLFKKVYTEFLQRDAASPLVIEGLVLEMLAEASRRQQAASEENTERFPRWLKIAIEIIHDRFSESLTLDEIAGAAGVHPVYLARAFRRHTGSTIGDYIRRLRVEYASRQILTTDASLLEIALTAGFSDQSHFSRIFKRRMGVTPAQYRIICLRS
jgi:AraC family transcriptional regulator